MGEGKWPDLAVRPVMPIGTIIVAFMSISIVACTFLIVAENVVGFLEFFEHLGVPAFVWEK